MSRQVTITQSTSSTQWTSSVLGVGTLDRSSIGVAGGVDAFGAAAAAQTAAEAYTDGALANFLVRVDVNAARPTVGLPLFDGGTAATPPPHAVTGDFWTHPLP